MFPGFTRSTQTMMDHSWWSYLRYDEGRDRPAVSWALVRRVAGYARPYRVQLVGTFADTRQRDGKDAVPGLPQRRHQALPAPSPVPCAMNEPEPHHFTPLMTHGLRVRMTARVPKPVESRQARLQGDFGIRTIGYG